MNSNVFGVSGDAQLPGAGISREVRNGELAESKKFRMADRVFTREVVQRNFVLPIQSWPGSLSDLWFSSISRKQYNGFLSCTSMAVIQGILCSQVDQASTFSAAVGLIVAWMIPRTSPGWWQRCYAKD